MSIRRLDSKSSKKPNKRPKRELPWAFAPVPDLLWGDPSFTVSQIITLAFLCKAWCLYHHYSIDRIATLVNLSSRQAIRIINALVERGFVTKARRESHLGATLVSEYVINTEVIDRYLDDRRIELERGHRLKIG